ncbi:MAG: HAD hydrolase family protein [Bacteroidetes bacterium]|nr:HAD hydrolase family protein [Bacteroidota bacterium]
MALDVDGVLTDGGMYYLESGDEMKKFNARDGHAILRLQKAGCAVGIISHGMGESEKIVAKRARVLQIEKVYVGPQSKLDILKEWCLEMNIDLDQVAYIGDDENDLGVINELTETACPADAVRAVKDQVKIILDTNGGDGCVREYVDKYLLEIS